MTTQDGAKPQREQDEETIHELQPWAKEEFRVWLAERHRPEPEGAD